MSSLIDPKKTGSILLALVIVCFADPGGWLNLALGLAVGEGPPACIGFVPLPAASAQLFERPILRNRFVALVVIINPDDSDLTPVLRC